MTSHKKSALAPSDENDRLRREIETLREQIRAGGRNAFLARVLENLPTPVFIKDTEHRWLFVNEKAREFMGMSRAQLVGHTDADFFPPEESDAFWRHEERVLKTGEHQSMEEDNTLHGLTRTMLTTKSLYIDPESVNRYILGVAQDITQRKEADRAVVRAHEELRDTTSTLRSVFESVPDGLMTVDSRLQVTAMNRAMREMCGECCRLFEPGDASCPGGCADALAAMVEEGRGVCEERCELVGPDGMRRLVLLTTSPLADDDGRVFGAVLAVRDVTRLETLEQELGERRSFHDIVGKSPQMQQVFQVLAALTDVDASVLITGESGTGKELVVEALHNGGPRAHGPLVRVNCSALSESILESELFGHVRGAFTGAVRDKVGRFQMAEGGTMFLDEIGDISAELQLKLLRVLEQKEYERVGEGVTRKADVRIVAATNVDLRERMERGLFREDLYYRLKVVEVRLPPLRERVGDVPLLVEHFVDRFARAYSKPIRGVSKRVMQTLMDHAWPGNVRELSHCIEHACILCGGRTIRARHLPRELTEPERHASRKATTVASASPTRPASPEDERRRIVETLARCENNKSRAARELGINRKTLYLKLHRLGIGL